MRRIVNALIALGGIVADSLGPVVGVATRVGPPLRMTHAVEPEGTR